MTHTERVIHMDIETITTLVVLVTTILGSHAMLRRDLRSEIGRVESRLDRIEARLDWLTERLFEVASSRAERQS